MSDVPAHTGGASKGTGKLIAVMIIGLAAAAVGLAYAVFYGVAADGGRGGAVAVGLSFLVLFTDRGTATDALELDNTDAAPDPELDLARIRGALTAMLDWQAQERIYLTITSVVGTVIWGFGDIIAVWCGAPLVRG